MSSDNILVETSITIIDPDTVTEEAGYKWNADTLELEKVVPKFKSKFKPFDKVLVRNNPFDLWYADIYLGYFKGKSFQELGLRRYWNIFW